MKEKDTPVYEELTFEEAMKMLEETVAKLEKGDVPLEKAVELYTEGMKLAAICSGRISDIESRISVLSESSPGRFTETDLEVIE